MVDLETFLTALFVLVDDFCKTHPLPTHPGPKWKLSPSEAITLLLFAQWARFRSERDFYRFASDRLRPLFPNLPSRPQLNRQWRALFPQVCAVLVALADLLTGLDDLYQVLDLAPVVTRDAKRRGSGWLAGQADIGKSTRLGWYEGLKAILAATPSGVLTGFGLAPASTKEQPFAESFFALRAFPHPACPSVGRAHRGRYYVMDNGFEGEENRKHWAEQYGIWAIYPPKRNARTPWPKALRRWLAHLRQIIETVVDKLWNAFRLDRERPHTLMGLFTRLAAKMALHNFCIWLNRQLERPALAFADLLGWA